MATPDTANQSAPQVDAEFAAMIPPLAADELEMLEASIKERGCLEPLTVWDGNVLLDGHNRLRICQRLGISFKTRAVGREVKTRDDAEIWILERQLARRNIHTFDKVRLQDRRAYILRRQGEANEAAGGKLAGRGRPKGFQNSGNPIQPVQTDREVAKAAGTSHDTVAKVNRISEKAVPEVVAALRANEISIHAAAKLANEEAAEQRRTIERIQTTPGKADKKRMAYACKLDDRDSNDWFTPEPYIQSAAEVLDGIDLDPYSSKTANRIVKANRFFTEATNALTQAWVAESIWMNPPYSANECRDAVMRFLEGWQAKEFKSGIFLVNNATETKWFQKALREAIAFCFTDHRIAFWNADGKAISGNTRGQAFFYFGKRPSRFAEVFATHGCVIMGSKVQ